MKQENSNSEDGLNTASQIGRISGLVPDLKSDLGKRQLGEVSRLLPILVVFHLCAAIAVSLLVGAIIPSSVLRGWQLAVIAVAVMLLFVRAGARRINENPERAQLVLRCMPYLGLVLAMVWVVPPLLFSQLVPLDMSVVVLDIMLAMLGIGVTTLLRVPVTAIVYASVLVLVLCQAVYKTLVHNQMVATGVVLLFGAALVGIILLVHLDYVQRHKTEFELSRQSQIIKLLLNDFERDTSDWLWETNRNGKLTYVSPSLANLLGQTTSQILGQDFAMLIDPEQNSFGKVMLSQTEIKNTILSLVYDGKPQYWQISGRPLLDEKQRFAGYRGVGRNVTHQHDSEIEIRKAKESAEQASAAKSQFLAVIGHELRTPINAIVGFCEVLSGADSESLPALSRKDYLKTILENSKQLQALISDILDATRIERGTLQLSEQDNDAAELVEVAIKICRDQASAAKISIVALLSDDVIVKGDMTRLKQVILNLLTNAMKFSPEGGVVNVEMQRGANSALVISIRDAGVGIGTEDALRVFEPFEQADGSNTRRYGGMGLGLSIARRIARMHGGDVTLEGEIGVGTDARLVLPAARVRWPQQNAKVSRKVAA